MALIDLYCDLLNPSLYGNFRTRTFNQLFPSAADFLDAYKNQNPLYNASNGTAISDTNVTVLWGLLSAYYGNTHIKQSDESEYTFKLFTIVYSYGATWQKQLELQAQLRGLTADELAQGVTQVTNHAANPGTNVTDGTTTASLLSYIDSQTGSVIRKDKTTQIATVLSLLRSDYTSEFLSHFKPLYNGLVVTPSIPLWYESED